MRGLAGVLLGLFVTASCGGESSNDDGGVRAGAAGAGTAGSSAGTSNGGGGQANTAGAECQTDADCRIVESCCSCLPAPVAEDSGVCDVVCEQSACGARGLAGVTAACAFNRCVFSLNCNRTRVTCRAAEPACPDGQIASVQDNCWGPCVQPTECSELSGCESCPASSNQVCVWNVTALPAPTSGCVEVTSACAENPTCECVSACAVQCQDSSGIQCSCPFC